MQENKYFLPLKKLALTALFCSVILLLFIWVESLVPGDKSAMQSDAISDNIAATFGDDDKAPEITSITAIKIEKHFRNGEAVNDETIYSDDAVGFRAVVKPKGADSSKVKFSSDGDGIVIAENGDATFSTWGWKTIRITSSDDENVFLDTSVLCYGKDPSFLSDCEIKIRESSQSGFTPLDGATLIKGKEYILRAFEKENNTEIAMPLFTINSDDKIFNAANTVLYPVKTGETTLSFTLKTPDGETVLTKNCEVVISDNGFSSPVRLSLNENATKIADGIYSFSVKKGSLVSIVDDMGLKAYDDKGNETARYFCVESSDHDVVNAFDNRFLAKKPGTCDLTYTSVYDEKVTLTFHVTVLPVGNKISITGNERCLKNGSVNLSAFIGGSKTDDVIWQVVKGNGKIDENGRFSATKTGKVTVRATSIANPGLTAEKTITVSRFSSFALAVRKGIGHFGLFALLGFGYTFTFFMLLKPRCLAPLAVAFSAFVSAGISEMFQLPAFTSGRYSTWTDVHIDFLGSLSGMGVAALIITVTAIIWRFARPESFKNLKDDFSRLTFKTAFARKKK
ncbi:MAG: VanZ family protein [Eubacteriales bacterium]|nr:VanZ family protein [Eubacteriales bacterium]